MKIRTQEDILALESRGFQAVYPERSPWDILRGGAERHGDGVAIRYLRDAADPGRDVVLTYRDLAGQVMAAARLFRSLGVVPGRSVAILSQHTPSAQTSPATHSRVERHATPTFRDPPVTHARAPLTSTSHV